MLGRLLRRVTASEIYSGLSTRVRLWAPIDVVSAIHQHVEDCCERPPPEAIAGTGEMPYAWSGQDWHDAYQAHAPDPVVVPDRPTLGDIESGSSPTSFTWSPSDVAYAVEKHETAPVVHERPSIDEISNGTGEVPRVWSGQDWHDAYQAQAPDPVVVPDRPTLGDIESGSSPTSFTWSPSDVAYAVEKHETAPVVYERPSIDEISNGTGEVPRVWSGQDWHDAYQAQAPIQVSSMEINLLSSLAVRQWSPRDFSNAINKHTSGTLAISPYIITKKAIVTTEQAVWSHATGLHGSITQGDTFLLSWVFEIEAGGNSAAPTLVIGIGDTVNTVSIPPSPLNSAGQFTIEWIGMSGSSWVCYWTLHMDGKSPQSGIWFDSTHYGNLNFDLKVRFNTAWGSGTHQRSRLISLRRLKGL